MNTSGEFLLDRGIWGWLYKLLKLLYVLKIFRCITYEYIHILIVELRSNIQECSFSIIKDILELLFASLFPSTLSCIKKHIKHSSLALVMNPE